MDRKEDPAVGIYNMFNAGSGGSGGLRVGEVIIADPLQIKSGDLILNRKNTFVNSIYFTEDNYLRKGDKVIFSYVSNRQRWAVLCRVI